MALITLDHAFIDQAAQRFVHGRTGTQFKESCIGKRFTPPDSQYVLTDCFGCRHGTVFLLLSENLICLQIFFKLMKFLVAVLFLMIPISLAGFHLLNVVRDF